MSNIFSCHFPIATAAGGRRLISPDLGKTDPSGDSSLFMTVASLRKIGLVGQSKSRLCQHFSLF
jgi:hypothetical protein